MYFGRECARNAELAAIPQVIRVLHYGDGQGDLTGRDLEFADWILRQDDRIGAFKALKGIVVKMDRRSKTFSMV